MSFIGRILSSVMTTFDGVSIAKTMASATSLADKNSTFFGASHDEFS